MADEQMTLEQFKTLLNTHTAKQQEKVKASIGSPEPASLSPLASLWSEFRTDQGLDAEEQPTDRQLVDFYTMAVRRLPDNQERTNSPRQMFLKYATRAGLDTLGRQFVEESQLPAAPGEAPAIKDALIRSGTAGFNEVWKHPEYWGRLGRGFKDGALNRWGGVLGRSMPDPTSGNISQAVEGTGQLYGSIAGEASKALAMPLMERALVATGFGAPAAAGLRLARMKKGLGGFAPLAETKNMAAIWAALGAGAGYSEANERDAANAQAQLEGSDAPGPMGGWRKAAYVGASALGDAANAVSYGATGTNFKDVLKSIIVDSTVNAGINAAQLGSLSAIAGDDAETSMGNALAGAIMGGGFGTLRAGGEGLKSAIGALRTPPVPASAMATHLGDIEGVNAPPPEVGNPLAGLQRRRNQIPANAAEDGLRWSHEVGRPVEDADIPGITPEMIARFLEYDELPPVVHSTMDERQAAANRQNEGSLQEILNARVNPDDAPREIRIGRPVPSHQTLTAYLNQGPVGILTRSGPEVGQTWTGNSVRGDVSSAVVKEPTGELGTKLMQDLYNLNRSVVWADDADGTPHYIPASHSPMGKRERVPDPGYEGDYLDVTGKQEAPKDPATGLPTGETTYSLNRPPKPGRPGAYAGNVRPGWSKELAALHEAAQRAAEKQKELDQTQQTLQQPRDPGEPPMVWDPESHTSELRRKLEDAKLMRSHAPTPTPPF